MADDVQIIFGAKIDDLIAGVDKVKNSLSGIQETTDRIGEGAKTMLEAFGVSLSIAGIIEFVNKMSELGETVETTATKLGLSNEAIVNLGGVAKLAGTSLDGVTQGISRMSLNIQRAASNALDPAAQGLKVLGLNAKELVGLPTDQYFEKLAGAVGKLNPSLNLTNALTAVGGRSVAALIPLLQKGEEGYRAMQLQVRAAQEGLAAAVPGMADTNTKIGLMSLSAQSFASRIFTALKPAIDSIITATTGWLQSMDTTKINAFVKDIVNYTADSIIAIGSLTLSLVETFAIVNNGLAPLLEKIKVLALGAAVGSALAGIRGAIAGAGIAAAVDMFAEQYKKLPQTAVQANVSLDAQREKLAELMRQFKELFANLGSSATPEGKKGSDAGAMNLNMAAQLSAQAAGIDAQIAQLQASLARKQLVYNFDREMFQTTESQKTAAARAALDEEYAAEKLLLDKKLALRRGQPEEEAKVKAQLLALDSKYSIESLKIQQDSIRATMATYQEFFSSLQSSFNGQLRGLLAGTTTWASAFKTITGDMIIYFIQAIEKMVFNWIAGKLAMSTADKTAQASQVATAAAGQAAQTATAVASVQQKVAEVYAGAAAFFAPLLGPGAPAAAAAVAAEVDAAATGIVLAGAAEQGAWEIPSTAPWLLHKGETVLPAPAAQAFRDMAQGGGATNGASGTHLHLHGTLIDGPSVARFFRDNAGLMATTLKDKSSLNPSKR